MKPFFVLGEQTDLWKTYKLGPTLLASINDQEKQIPSNSVPEVPSPVYHPLSLLALLTPGRRGPKVSPMKKAALVMSIN